MERSKNDKPGRTQKETGGVEGAAGMGSERGRGVPAVGGVFAVCRTA